MEEWGGDERRKRRRTWGVRESKGRAGREERVRGVRAWV